MATSSRTIGAKRSREVSVSLEPREARVESDGWANAEVVVRIPEGLSINTNDPTAKWLTPTSLQVEGVYGEASFPTTAAEKWEGEVRIALRLRPKKAATEEFALRVRYQPCTETECLLPQESILTGVVLVE